MRLRLLNNEWKGVLVACIEFGVGGGVEEAQEKDIDGGKVWKQERGKWKENRRKKKEAHRLKLFLSHV